jgi:hypothetical protein
LGPIPNPQSPIKEISAKLGLYDIILILLINTFIIK